MTPCSDLHECFDIPNPRTPAFPRPLFDNSPTSPAHLNPQVASARSARHADSQPPSNLGAGLSSTSWRPWRFTPLRQSPVRPPPKRGNYVAKNALPRQYHPCDKTPMLANKDPWLTWPSWPTCRANFARCSTPTHEHLEHLGHLPESRRFPSGLQSSQLPTAHCLPSTSPVLARQRTGVVPISRFPIITPR
jgi:hypothetical protein